MEVDNIEPQNVFVVACEHCGCQVISNIFYNSEERGETRDVPCWLCGKVTVVTLP